MDSHDLFKKLTAGIKFQSQKKEQQPIKSEVVINNVTGGTSRDKSEQGSILRKKYKIAVKGKNIPTPVETFEELRTAFDLNPRIIENLKNSGYSAPTPIQMQSIPALLKDRQVLACAPTGSGKTAAFLVPIITQLKKPSRDGFRALILCPTRELARQIFRECTRLAEGTGLKPHIITKVSSSTNKYGPNFSKKFDILISTPNRLIYLLKQEDNILNLKTVEWLIVDESDKLFEVGLRGFRDQLAEIYLSCDNPDLKRAMFSATFTAPVARWCKNNLKNVLSITVGHRNTTVHDVEQELIYVGSETGKLQAIRTLIQEGLSPPVLIFVQSKERAKQLFNELIFDGISVDVIHADRTQLQRDNVVRAFREGKVWVLICTELMGRGIDFVGIKLVINYDFPASAISYIHRIGRTGRAGRPGKAITYFTNDDKLSLRNIARVMKDSGCPVPDYMLTLKKVKKSDRLKKEVVAPDRKPISTSISYEKYKKNKKDKCIAKTKKLKEKQSQDESA